MHSAKWKVGGRYKLVETQLCWYVKCVSQNGQWALGLGRNPHSNTQPGVLSPCYIKSVLQFSDRPLAPRKVHVKILVLKRILLNNICVVLFNTYSHLWGKLHASRTQFSERKIIKVHCSDVWRNVFISLMAIWIDLSIWK